VEKAARRPICFHITASDVRKEHVLQNDETPRDARSGFRLRNLRTPGSGA